MIFGFVDKLAVPVLLRKIFIDWFINSINTDETEIVPLYTLPVPILMVRETGSVAEKDS